MLNSKELSYLMIGECAIIFLSPEGNVLNWNKGAEKTNGYKPKEIIGENFRLFFTKEDREKKLPGTLIDTAKKHGEAGYEGWQVKKNGHRFWGSIVITSVYDKKNRLTGFSGVIIDLTQKKHTTDADKIIDQVRIGFMKLFNASPSGMTIADMETGELMEVNESFLKTFNFKRSEAIGLTGEKLGFVSPETQERVFNKLKRQGYLKNENVPAITKDGKGVDTVFSVEIFEIDNKPCFLSIFHDITELKEMERLIVESEAKYRKIIEEAGDVLYISDVKGKFTYINQRIVNLTEYTISELMGQHFSILIAPEWQEKVRNNYRDQYVNSLLETVMEFQIVTKSGKKKWVEQVAIIQFEKKAIKSFQCVVHDITDRMEASILQTMQKQIIEQKNKDIFDSINYSKRIQDAIFPPAELIKELLPNAFILFKPKEVISGDFYWVEKSEGKIFVAVADCTGHGVPGALMSIIGYNLLGKSINEYGYARPDEILNELSRGINETLRKSEDSNSVKDTIDIALCSINLDTNTLNFAGAHNPLYIIRKGELIEIAANRFPVGVFLDGELQKFTNHEIQLFKDDIIYLSSDGYPDQFGGPSGKKLMYKKFREILLSIQNLPLEEQRARLDDFIEAWRWKNEEQTDDILVVGIKI